MGNGTSVGDMRSGAQSPELPKESVRGEKVMSGLSVLYTSEATQEREWAAIPDKDKTGRLREVFWAMCAEGHLGPKMFVGATPIWRFDRCDIDRRRDEPGDSFAYIATVSIEGIEAGFEWLEVTEVFTTVPPEQIEAAMRAWNGLPNRQPMDLDDFLEHLDRGRPSRAAQRRAADQVIKMVEKKLAMSSYNELMEKYGYGTLVVGMPLWYAVPPEDPLRPRNGLDEFVTRTQLGLEDVRRRKLKRSDCPFKQVIVLWDTTTEAMQEWEKRRSEFYNDVANSSLENPMSMSTLTELLGLTPPKSIMLHAIVNVQKRRPAMALLPETAQKLQKIMRKQEKKRAGLRKILKQRAAVIFLKLYWFAKFRGVHGLRKWIAGRLSLSRLWKASMTVYQARRLYRESVRLSGARAGRRHDDWVRRRVR